MLFIVLWALLNSGFGTALDGPIAAFFMEKPCQRLDGTAERLTGYTLGGGSKGMRSTPAVCHFGPRSVTVGGPIAALGFRWREFQVIVIGLVGYAVCFASAGVGTFALVLQSGRLISRLGRWCRPSPVTGALATPQEAPMSWRGEGTSLSRTGIVNLTQKAIHSCNKKRTLARLVLSRTPVFSPPAYPQIAS